MSSALRVAVLSSLPLLACSQPHSDDIAPTDPGGKADDTRELGVDLEAALLEIELGHTVDGESAGPALQALLPAPASAAAAWHQAYLDPRIDRRTLAYLAGEVCLPSVASTMADYVERVAALPPPQDCFDGGEDRVSAAVAVRSLGRMAREVCRQRSPQSHEEALGILSDWISDDDGAQMSDAAFSLLIAAPEEAAKLRRQVGPRVAESLRPLSERRVDLEVDDSEPEPTSEATGPSHEVCEPEPELDPSDPEFYEYDCGAPFDLPINRDAFIDQQIAINASFFGQETCNEFAERYDKEAKFENDKWDGGFGIHSPCDSRKPFKRAINALWLLENSPAENNPPGDFSGGVIGWAYDYVVRKTPEFQGTCKDEKASAMFFPCTILPEFLCDRRIELRKGFHITTPVSRASIILHEARHAGGWDHNGDKCSSCDEKYSFRGTLTIEVQWLAQFARDARYKTPLMVTDAIAKANSILGWLYDKCPEVRIGPDGWFVSDPTNCFTW